MKNQTYNYLAISLLSIFLFTSCSKKKDNPSSGSGGEITATFQFSEGESVDFAFTSQADDIIKPYLNGPNQNNHYKLYLRGEREIDGKIYTINLYVTMPEDGVGNYPFGRAWQWYDEGFVTEIHVGVTEKGNPLSLKQYTSMDIDNSSSNGTSISSLTDNRVKGTFSGVLAYSDSDTMTITNGKFDLAISRGDWED